MSPQTTFDHEGQPIRNGDNTSHDPDIVLSLEEDERGGLIKNLGKARFLVLVMMVLPLTLGAWVIINARLYDVNFVFAKDGRMTVKRKMGGRSPHLSPALPPVREKLIKPVPAPIKALPPSATTAAAAAATVVATAKRREQLPAVLPHPSQSPASTSATATTTRSMSPTSAKDDAIFSRVRVRQRSSSTTKPSTTRRQESYAPAPFRAPFSGISNIFVGNQEDDDPLFTGITVRQRRSKVVAQDQPYSRRSNPKRSFDSEAASQGGGLFGLFGSTIGQQSSALDERDAKYFEVRLRSGRRAGGRRRGGILKVRSRADSKLAELEAAAERAKLELRRAEKREAERLRLAKLAAAHRRAEEKREERLANREAARLAAEEKKFMEQQKVTEARMAFEERKAQEKAKKEAVRLAKQKEKEEKKAAKEAAKLAESERITAERLEKEKKKLEKENEKKRRKAEKGGLFSSIVVKRGGEKEMASKQSRKAAGQPRSVKVAAPEDSFWSIRLVHRTHTIVGDEPTSAEAKKKPPSPAPTAKTAEKTKKPKELRKPKEPANSKKEMAPDSGSFWRSIRLSNRGRKAKSSDSPSQKKRESKEKTKDIPKEKPARKRREKATTEKPKKVPKKNGSSSKAIAVQSKPSRYYAVVDFMGGLFPSWPQSTQLFPYNAAPLVEYNAPEKVLPELLGYFSGRPYTRQKYVTIRVRRPQEIISEPRIPEPPSDPAIRVRRVDRRHYEYER